MLFLVSDETKEDAVPRKERNPLESENRGGKQLDSNANTIILPAGATVASSK